MSTILMDRNERESYQYIPEGQSQHSYRSSQLVHHSPPPHSHHHPQVPEQEFSRQSQNHSQPYSRPQTSDSLTTSRLEELYATKNFSLATPIAVVQSSASQNLTTHLNRSSSDYYNGVQATGESRSFSQNPQWRNSEYLTPATTHPRPLSHPPPTSNYEHRASFDSHQLPSSSLYSSTPFQTLLRPSSVPVNPPSEVDDAISSLLGARSGFWSGSQNSDQGMRTSNSEFSDHLRLNVSTAQTYDRPSMIVPSSSSSSHHLPIEKPRGLPPTQRPIPTHRQVDRRTLSPPPSESSRSSEVDQIRPSTSSKDKKGKKVVKASLKITPIPRGPDNELALPAPEDTEFQPLGYGRLIEHARDPPTAGIDDDELKPQPQFEKLKFDGDRYTPRYVRGLGIRREGWCSSCPGGSWHKLKNSAFNFHQLHSHGISSTTGQRFAAPLDLRLVTKNKKSSRVEGFCGKCEEWVVIMIGKRRPAWGNWFHHCHSCYLNSNLGEGGSGGKDKGKKRKGKSQEVEEEEEEEEEEDAEFKSEKERDGWRGIKKTKSETED